MNEVPLPGYETLYIVREDGTITSVPRVVRHYTGKMLNRKQRVLTQTRQGKYLKVALCKGGVTVSRRVHVLVALAFLGPRPSGTVVRHLDGNAFNNHRSNLAYGSQLENVNDMRTHGTLLLGEKHPRAKITAAIVKAIRRQAKTKSHRELARDFGISKAQIYNILKRIQWRHV